MSPLQKFQIAFADYSAGHLTFDTLMACANEANAEHPNYVASLLQKFKMSKSASAQDLSLYRSENRHLTDSKAPESKGLDLEALKAADALADQIDRMNNPERAHELANPTDEYGMFTSLFNDYRRLRAGAEGGDLGMGAEAAEELDEMLAEYDRSAVGLAMATDEKSKQFWRRSCLSERNKIHDFARRLRSVGKGA